MFPVEDSHLLDNPVMIWPIAVEPWDRGTLFKWPLSRKGQDAAKSCPLIRGSVTGEFTDNFVHPGNQPLNKGRPGDMGWGWGETF